MIRLIVSLIAAVVTILADQAHAQGAFPAPLPNAQSAPADVSPFPPVNGTAPPVLLGAPPSRELSDACKKGFIPLRDEAERRGRLIKEASDRKAPRDEACKLIESFGQAEFEMIGYVDANSAKCGMPQHFATRLKAGHAKTEQMWKRLCAVPGV